MKIRTIRKLEIRRAVLRIVYVGTEVEVEDGATKRAGVVSVFAGTVMGLGSAWVERRLAYALLLNL